MKFFLATKCPKRHRDKYFIGGLYEQTTNGNASHWRKADRQFNTRTMRANGAEAVRENEPLLHSSHGRAETVKEMKRMKVMKKIFGIIGVLGFVLILLSAGETDGSLIGETQALLMGIAGLAMLAIGLKKGGAKK